MVDQMVGYKVLILSVKRLVMLFQVMLADYFELYTVCEIFFCFLFANYFLFIFILFLYLYTLNENKCFTYFQCSLKR